MSLNDTLKAKETRRPSELIDAVYKKEIADVKKMVKEGVDVNAMGSYSPLKSVVSPLDAACEIKDADVRKDMVDFLIKSGANVNPEIPDVTPDGWRTGAKSPLTRALYNGYMDTFETLFQHGADITKCAEEVRKDIAMGSSYAKEKQAVLHEQYGTTIGINEMSKFVNSQRSGR